MVRCGSEIGHRKDTCLIEIGLRAQNMLTILGSMVNMIEADLHDHLMDTRTFTLKYIRCSYELQKLRGKWLCPQFGFANHLALVAYFRSYQNWVQ